MLIAAVAAIALFVALIQTPAVQTRIIGKLTADITDNLDADITFGKINLRPFNTLVIRDLCIRDREPVAECDTLFTADYIVATFSLKGLLQAGDGNGVHLHSALVRGGLFNLVMEDGGRCNLQRMFNLKPKTERTRSEKEIFSIDKIRVVNFAYGMQNVRTNRQRKEKKHGSGIDWDDLYVYEINLNGEHMRLSKGVMTGTVNHLDCREKSGFHCSHLSGSTAVGNGLTKVTDISFKDGDSDISLPLFTMSYKDSREFKDFIGRVSMGFEFDNTYICSRTLAHFAPVLGICDLDLVLNGKVNGPVSSLHCNDFRAETTDRKTGITLNGDINGLPDIRNTVFKLRITNCSSSVSDIENLIRRASGRNGFSLCKTIPQANASLWGSANGSLADLSTQFALDTDLGDISAELEIEHILSDGNPLSVGGVLHAADVQLGKITGKSVLGDCTLRTGLHACLDKTEGPSLKIDSLMVDKLGVAGYEYHSLAAAGTVAGDSFNGRIISRDEAFNFIFQGVFSLSPRTRNSVYQFYANIGHADLFKMNLDKREGSTASLAMNANFNRTAGGHVLGNISIADLRLESEGQNYDIGDISIASHSLNKRYRINFDSSFAQAWYDGTRPVTDFVSALIAMTARKELPVLFRNEAVEDVSGTYDVSFSFTDPSDLTAFIKPGFYIDKNTSLNMHASEDGITEATLKSKRIAIKEQYIKDISLKFDNRNEIISGELDFGEINLAGVSLQNNSMRFYANDNCLGVGLSFENDSQLITKGELIARGELFRNVAGSLGMNISVLPSGFYFNSAEWNVMPASISLCAGEMKFDGVEISGGDQSVRVNGGISKTTQDTLSVALERFEIGIANPFVAKGKIDLKGALTGELLLSSGKSGKGITAGFISDSTRFAGTPLGTVYAESLWNNEFNRFDVSLHNELDNTMPLSAKANYYPSTGRIEATADLDKQDITCLKVLLTGVFSEINGTVSGRVNAEGPFKALEISSSNARINNALLTVDYTRVPYYADGPFRIDSEGLHFDGISMKDMQRGKGKVNGDVFWDHFKDINLDIHIDAENVEAINRPFKDNDGYYGRVFGTGKVDICGPLKEVQLSVDMQTNDQSRFYIPLSNTSTAGTTDILKFKEVKVEVQTDPYEEMIAKLKSREATKNKNSFGVNINAHVNRLAEAFLEINRDNGSVISGRGRGDINVDFKTGRPLSLKGDYTLDEGSFHLNLMNLANRDFTINEDSSIKFNGGIMDTDLDIDAVYTTKTSISTLIGDTTSVNSRRNVNCKLNIGGKLREPKVSFAIDIPDLEPAVKAKVENALSTDDKVQRQTIALLVTNTFLQDDQSGITNTTSGALYSNAMSIVTNQLNSILTKLGIPLDFGVKYQQNDKGNDVFDVAVSTQLFNNRVVINGNIGNRQYKNGNSNSEVAGDIDMEIKLDRSGSLRLNLFTHSADQYTNYLDNSQRSGLGMAYQKEFNSWKELFRYMFAGKAKREQLDLEYQNKLQEEGLKTIVIE